MRTAVLFLIWFCPMAMGQIRLKPGTYHNFKSTEAIVLDTGTYIFIGLEMNYKVLPSGVRGPELVWLDASKANRLTLQACRFEGDGSGTAVVGSKNLSIVQSVFTHLDTAVKEEAQGQEVLKLIRNRFEDNATAIALTRKGESGTALVSFSLKCNEFIHHQQEGNVLRKGIVIGEGIRLGFMEAGYFMHDRLGGEGRQFSEGFAYPNGNLWPTAQSNRKQKSEIWGMRAEVHHPDTTIGWANSQHWMAIDNQSGHPIRYFRYENEFVGWGPAIAGEVEFSLPDPNRKWRLEPGETTDTCLWKTHQPKGMDNAMVCEQLVDEQPFLLPTHISVGELGKARPDLATEVLLELPLSVPVRVATRIHFWVPETIQQAVLQYLDSNEQVLQNNPIRKRGWQTAHLDLRYTEVGIYGYRLVVDGKPGETKKLVVVK